MMKKIFLIVCFALIINFEKGSATNMFSSFVSLVKAKLNGTKEVSKIVQMDNSSVCLTNSSTTAHSECFCSFKKLKEFEKKCASKFKRSQEDAKICSEEKCEYCCKLVQPQESSMSILEYEVVCQKKCSKSDVLLNLKDEEYRTVFKKMMEFIRIFYPANTLNYYPIENKTAQYTNRPIGQNMQKISEDLKMMGNEDVTENVENYEETEDMFSPYNEY